MQTHVTHLFRRRNGNWVAIIMRHELLCLDVRCRRESFRYIFGGTMCFFRERPTVIMYLLLFDQKGTSIAPSLLRMRTTIFFLARFYFPNFVEQQPHAVVSHEAFIQQ